MIARIKCFFGWHKYEVIEFTNLYKGDMGMELKCKYCGRKEFDNGIPPG